MEKLPQVKRGEKIVRDRLVNTGVLSPERMRAEFQTSASFDGRSFCAAPAPWSPRLLFVGRRGLGAILRGGWVEALIGFRGPVAEPIRAGPEPGEQGTVSASSQYGAPERRPKSRDWRGRVASQKAARGAKAGRALGQLVAVARRAPGLPWGWGGWRVSAWGCSGVGAIGEAAPYGGLLSAPGRLRGAREIMPLVEPAARKRAKLPEGETRETDWPLPVQTLPPGDGFSGREEWSASS